MATPPCTICGGYSTNRLREYRSIGPSSELFLPMSIYRCLTCTGLFAFEPPSEEQLDYYYASCYRTDKQESSTNVPLDGWHGSRVRARSQIDFIQPDKRLTSWLDIGAGYGRLLDQARKNGFSTTAGVELSAPIASSHVLYRNIDEVRGLWDVVSFSHVLEHFATPNRFLTRVKQLIAPGGLAFCEVPNEVWSDRKNDTPHLTFYTPRALQCVFERAGFRVVRIDTAGPNYSSRRRTEWFLRGVGRRLWEEPPLWFDRMCHPEFHYRGVRSRIRVLATVD